MPMYGFICPNCGATTQEFAPMRQGPPTAFCGLCSALGVKPNRMVRDYKADAPFIAAVPQSYFSPSLGREISDQRQVSEQMKRITEESVARTGYEPKLVAHHHSEVGPAAESYRDPTGQALENAMKAARDGAKPNAA
jgi:hypothetical protein